MNETNETGPAKKLRHMTAKPASLAPQYEPHERPPPLLALGLGVQSALLVIAPIALFPIVLVQAVGGSGPEVAWAVFAMLAVNGAATILQAFRAGPMGSGLLVITYPSPTAIPFCIIALEQGGAATLAALIVTSGLFQIVVSMRLSLLRRLVTPAISGAILILLVITIVPVIFDSLNDVPEGAPAAAGPVCILVTFAVIVGLLLRGSGAWRVWSSLIGIAAGCAAGVAFGIYDFGPVREAPVTGLPIDGWAGLGFNFGAAFWSLLPAFLFLSVIAVLQGASVGLSTQRVSWRKSRAMDYRRVQGLSFCTGLGNLLAGVSAVMPLTISPRGTVFAQQTGCASRDVGIITGVLLIAAAFFPKSWSLLIGIPAPVTAIFLVVMISPLLVEGMKMIVQETPDYRMGLVIGSALLIGMGLQTGLVALPIGDLWESVFQRAFTAGGAALILLTVFAEFNRRKNQRLRTEVSMEALPGINRFLESFAAGHGWDSRMTNRLQAVAEEMLIILSKAQGDEPGGDPKRLFVSARSHGPSVELEFVSATGSAENLEDRIALLTSSGPEAADMDVGDLEQAVERDASLRLLQHYAASVTHRQYHDIEIVTTRVTSSTGE